MISPAPTASSSALLPPLRKGREGGVELMPYAKRGTPDHLPLKRRLRSRMTPAEARLWSALRLRQVYGLKFRRQHGIGPYIVDCYCPERALVIEVDGDTHGEADQHGKDRARDLAGLIWSRCNVSLDPIGPARSRAGQARAKAKGKRFGRRRVPQSIQQKVLELRRQQNYSIRKIAKTLHIGHGPTQRIIKEAAAASLKDTTPPLSSILHEVIPALPRL